MNLLGAIGQAKPVSEFINTAGQYQTTQSNLESQRLQQQKQQAELKKAEDDAKYMKTRRNMTVSPIVLAQPEDQREPFIKMLKQAGAMDEDGFGTPEDGYRFLAEVHKSEESMKNVYKPSLDALAEEVIKARKKVTENPDDPVVRSKYEELDMRYQKQSGKFYEALKEIRTNDAKMREQEGKREVEADKQELVERRLDLAEQTATDRYEQGERRLDILDRNSATLAKNAETAAKRALSSGGQLSLADKEALRAMGKQLPKTQALARTAEKNIQKIERMEALVASGAGGVLGELLAKINKVSDLFRRTSPEDAKYNVLKSEIIGLAGSLRLQLGLVGQTSDRDVQIMQEAAGMSTPAESQKALLAGYKTGFMQDIDNYNSDAEAYSEYSPAGKSLYKPIKVESGKPSAGTGTSPKKADWIAAARKSNPGTSDKELGEYYDTKYGGK